MKIGFVGPFGDANFGDYAMLVNNVLTIGCHDVYLFSYNKEIAQELIQSYLKGYDVKIYWPDVEDSYVPMVSDKYFVEYDDEVFLPNEIINKISNSKEIRDALLQVDCIVVCGGGYFNRIWCAKHRKAKLIAMMGTLLMADQMEIDTIFLGNTYGPFQSSAEFFGKFFTSLKHAVLATRDNVYSISYMRDIGIERELFLLPDDLYFIDQEILSKKHSEAELPQKYMVLELYSSIDEIKHNMENVRVFVKQMKQNYNLDVILLPLDKGYGGEYQANFLLQHIPELFYIDFGNSRIRKMEEVISIVCGAEFVLCQRYHMAVVAVANNIPYIHVLKKTLGGLEYYYTKSKGLLNQVFENQTIQDDYFMASDVSSALKKLCMSYDEVIGYQKAFFNKYKKMAETEMMLRRLDYINRYVRR